MGRRRLTIADAAQELGITVDAARQRLRRGKLERAEPPTEDDKRVYVWLNVIQTEHQTESRHDVQGEDRAELLDTYRQQLEWFRREVERKDAIILSLVQRVPELEALPDERDTRVSATEEPERGTPPQGAERRSWWRRLFEG